MPSQTLLAGQKAELSIEVSAIGFGERSSVITIRTDSSETPTIQIPIRIHGMKLVPPFISFAPSELHLEAVLGTSLPTKTFQITCVESPGDPWLEGFKVNSVKLLVKQPRIIKEERLDSTTLLRNYEAEIQPGTMSLSASEQTLRLSPITRTVAAKTFPPISVKISEVPAVRAAPSSVVFSFSDQGSQTIDRPLVLIASDNTKWQITSADADVPWIGTRITIGGPIAGTRKMVLSATSPEWQKSKSEQGEVRIRTTHPQCPEIVVRVTAVRG